MATVGAIFVFCLLAIFVVIGCLYIKLGTSYNRFDYFFVGMLAIAAGSVNIYLLYIV